MAGVPTQSHHVNVLGTPEASDALLITCAKSLGVHLHFYWQPAEFVKASITSPPEFLIVDLDCYSEVAQLQSELLRGGYQSVIIAIAFDLNVETAIQLMQSGTLMLLQKPVQEIQLEGELRKALGLSKQEREMRNRYASFLERLAALSPRQREVFWSVIDGQQTKAIAFKLNVSVRLVELERARLLKIFEAESTAAMAFKIGEQLMIGRTLSANHQPHFLRLRSTAESNQPLSPDV